MGFLRRLRGGDPGSGPRVERPGGQDDRGAADGSNTTSADEDEAARDRELMRGESQRLEDDLLQRQMRYADRSWTPPPQGGPRRAGDEDTASE